MLKTLYQEIPSDEIKLCYVKLTILKFTLVIYHMQYNNMPNTS